MNEIDHDQIVHTLKNEIKKSSDARFLNRLHCVLLVINGKSTTDVASLLGIDASSVARWVRHFSSFGVEGLRDDQKTGRPSKLSYDQIQEVSQDLQNTPGDFGLRTHCWNGKTLAKHIEKKYGVALSIRQCQRLLQQHHQQENSLTESIA